MSPAGTTPRVRQYRWTEANWLREVQDNGDVTSFLYDGAGERVAKRGKYGETTYVGQFYSVKNGQLGTKHIFAGTSRLASKSDEAGSKNVATAGSGTGGSGSGVYGADGRLIGVPLACVSGVGAKTGLGEKCPDGIVGTPGQFLTVGGRSRTYYFHPDHLGSSSYLTDEEGEVFEHVEYFPFGEVWREDGPNRPVTVSEYRFTGKPEDPETGLVYFGARYYSPRLARWHGTDPEFLAQGAIGLNPFQYGLWSPVRNVDPDGRMVLVDPLDAATNRAARSRYSETLSAYLDTALDPVTGPLLRPAISSSSYLAIINPTVDSLGAEGLAAPVAPGVTEISVRSDQKGTDLAWVVGHELGHAVYQEQTWGKTDTTLNPPFLPNRPPGMTDDEYKSHFPSSTEPPSGRFRTKADGIDNALMASLFGNRAAGRLNRPDLFRKYHGMLSPEFLGGEFDPSSRPIPPNVHTGRGEQLNLQFSFGVGELKLRQP